jgi:hypothetical protein
MTPAEIQLALALIELIMKVGVPTAINAIKQFEIDDDPTPDQISRLSDMLKDPAQYFKCGG